MKTLRSTFRAASDISEATYVMTMFTEITAFLLWLFAILVIIKDFGVHT